jgi:hypothetical protein
VIDHVDATDPAAAEARLMTHPADAPPDPLALALWQLARGAQTAAARAWAEGLLRRGECHQEGGVRHG